MCSICASCCILNELHFSKNPLILNFMVTELFQADVGTDMTKLIIILRNFSKASNYQKRNSGSRSNASDLKSGDAALQTPTGCRILYSRVHHKHFSSQRWIQSTLSHFTGVSFYYFPPNYGQVFQTISYRHISTTNLNALLTKSVSYCYMSSPSNTP